MPSRSIGSYLAGPCLAVAALPGLTACNERVVASEPSSAYSMSEVSYAASDRDLRVVLYGNPFGEDPQLLARRVTQAMQNRIMGVQTNPTTMPNETARPDYKIVLVFNPVETMLSSSICSGGPIRTHAPGQSIVMLGAFCRSGGALSSATGWLDQGSSTSDPDFRQLIADMMYSLFRNRSAENDGCSGPDC